MSIVLFIEIILYNCIKLRTSTILINSPYACKGTRIQYMASYTLCHWKWGLNKIDEAFVDILPACEWRQDDYTIKAKQAAKWKMTILVVVCGGFIFFYFMFTPTWMKKSTIQMD